MLLDATLEKGLSSPSSRRFCPCTGAMAGLRCCLAVLSEFSALFIRWLAGLGRRNEPSDPLTYSQGVGRFSEEVVP